MSAEDYTNQVDAYLRDELSEAERTAFEQAVEADPVLKKQFILDLLAFRAAELDVEDHIRSLIREVAEEPAAESMADRTAPGPGARVIPIWQRGWARAAVAACILVILGIFAIDQITGGPGEAGNYSTMAQELLELPGSTDDLSDPGTADQLEAARTAFFENKDYAEAAQLLTPIAADTGEYHWEANYLLAYSHFKNGDYDAALNIFDYFLSDPARLQALPRRYQSLEKLRWDKILAFLGQENLAALRSELNQFIETNPDQYYLDKANDLRAKLPDD